MAISAERVRTRKSATIVNLYLDLAAKGLVGAVVTRSGKEIANISHPKDYVPADSIVCGMTRERVARGTPSCTDGSNACSTLFEKRT
ncbi:hypothetical protein E4U17_001719, partial [Claviceps sp. LM77 group G4]